MQAAAAKMDREDIIEQLSEIKMERYNLEKTNEVIENHEKTEGDEGTEEQNPRFMFSTESCEILGMVARGEIDAQYLAKRELANRGHDTDGRWIGFKEAALFHFGTEKF